MEFFEHKIKSEPEEKYTKFSDLRVSPFEQKLSSDLKMLNLEPGPAPEIGFMPKVEQVRRENISDRIKRLEETHKETVETPSGGVRVFPQLSRTDEPGSVSPRPSAEAVAMEKLWTTAKSHEVPDFLERKTSEQHYTWASRQETNIGTCHEVPREIVPDESLRKYSITSTKKIFEDKLKEAPELVAPQLVRQVSEKKERPRSVHELFHAIHLEPGSPPEEYSTASLIKNISVTTTQYKYLDDQQLEPLPYTVDPPQAKRPRIPAPPSPSKFIKGEFRESDYESDYEGRIAPVWRPTDSDSEPHYRPVRPILTPTGRRSGVSDGHRSPTPPSEFDRRPRPSDAPVRPKFEPIDKINRITETSYSQMQRQHHQQQQQQAFVHKPTPVTSTRYFTATASAPVHNTIATETSNTMHMREHTETSHRVVNMNQTTRVIKFDGGQRKQSDFEQHLEPFPYAPTNGDTSPRPRVSLPPTPTRFVKGDFRESDYESEVDAARIRPVWTPNPSDGEEPHYRRVCPPQSTRSASCPRSYPAERVLTPMEFDTHGPLMPQLSPTNTAKDYRTQTLDRYATKRVHQYVTKVTQDDSRLRQNYDHAQHQMKDMGSSIKVKANQFMRDISSDMKHSTVQKPILKKATENEPQAYREQSRISQYDQRPGQRIQTPVNFSKEDKPKKPPSVITPLKDIAVVAGQTARFECIVQSDPHPEVIWCRNGVAMGRSLKHHIEYRNGVCRLTIPHAFTEDAGTYSCTASNQLGSVTTSADLLVPGNKWGVRK